MIQSKKDLAFYIQEDRKRNLGESVTAFNPTCSF